jgi:hypothetical protein
MNQTGQNKDKGRMRTVPNWSDSTWERKRQLAHDMKLQILNECRLSEAFSGRCNRGTRHCHINHSVSDDYTIPEGERLDDNNWEYPTKQ